MGKSFCIQYISVCPIHSCTGILLSVSFRLMAQRFMHLESLVKSSASKVSGFGFGGSNANVVLCRTGET